jgi:hypothetical protein
MQRVVFADSWSRFFAEFGLTSFDDFFEHSTAKTIGRNNKCSVVTFSRNNKRSVVTFSPDADPQKRQFFMKRFLHPHFKDMLFTRRNLGEFCSQARYEWENARLLLDNGIETYRPVCYGETTKWGVENKSFVVTEKLQTRCLTDFVRQEWHSLDKQQKETIMTGLAAFVRRIHALNVSMPDLYVWHIFLAENAAGKYDFAVIDLHRMSRNVTNKNHMIKNLGRLNHSMRDSYFDEELKQLFIESYAANSWDGDVAALMAQVKSHSDAISARRKQRPY